MRHTVELGLKSLKDEDPRINRDIVEIINTNGILLEQMGVVSDIGINLSDEIRNNGGAIKMCGGGGRGDGPTGAMLAYQPDKNFLDKIISKYNIKKFEVNFGGEGVTY